MKRFEIIISTMNQMSINDDFFTKRNIYCNCLVINQGSLANIDCLNNEKYKAINSRESGLSNSRNLALTNSDSEICLISDDDLILDGNVEETVIEAFKSHPKADIITFRITMAGNEHDRLPIKKFIHNSRTILSVGSNEIAFRRNSIIEKGIMFNSKFGLGSTYVSGEENLFLKDCLDSDLTLMHIPIVISNHLAEICSNDSWGGELIKAKGAFFAVYSNNSFVQYIYMMILIIMKRRQYRGVSVMKFIENWLEGAKDVRKK